MTKQERIRTEQWVRKLCEPYYVNDDLRKNRNRHADLLLKQIEGKKLNEPFTHIPPEKDLSILTSAELAMANLRVRGSPVKIAHVSIDQHYASVKSPSREDEARNVPQTGVTKESLAFASQLKSYSENDRSDNFTSEMNAALGKSLNDQLMNRSVNISLNTSESKERLKLSPGDKKFEALKKRYGQSQNTQSTHSLNTSLSGIDISINGKRGLSNSRLNTSFTKSAAKFMSPQNKSSTASKSSKILMKTIPRTINISLKSDKLNTSMDAKQSISPTKRPSTSVTRKKSTSSLEKNLSPSQTQHNSKIIGIAEGLKKKIEAKKSEGSGKGVVQEELGLRTPEKKQVPNPEILLSIYKSPMEAKMEKVLEAKGRESNNVSNFVDEVTIDFSMDSRTMRKTSTNSINLNREPIALFEFSPVVQDKSLLGPITYERKEFSPVAKDKSLLSSISYERKEFSPVVPQRIAFEEFFSSDKFKKNPVVNPPSKNSNKSASNKKVSEFLEYFKGLEDFNSTHEEIKKQTSEMLNKKGKNDYEILKEARRQRRKRGGSQSEGMNRSNLTQKITNS